MTGQEKTIFLTDKPGDIKSKINKFAFSAGGATLEEHRANGANLDDDVPYQYLRYGNRCLYTSGGITLKNM